MAIKGLVTIKQLEELLQVSRQTIYDWRKEGMPYIQINGRSVRFDYDEVIEWLKSRSRED